MTPRTDLRAVLWDMDGTLLDSEKVWDVALYNFCRYLGGEMSESLRHSLIGSSGPTAMRLVFAHLEIDPTDKERGDASRWLSAHTHELFRAGVPWRDGAEDALRLTREAGLGSALVTNTKRDLAEIGLETIGRHWFDVTVAGDEVETGKPAPDPYARAAELLGLEPRQCLAVEDSPTGADSAEAAGCALLVVPCAIDVPLSPRRVFRNSLVGLTIAGLRDAFSQSGAAAGPIRSSSA